MKNSETLFCSLDLELTGFDPSRDTILEVGFVFFRVSPTGLEITEQWSQTFKSLFPVHPKILGLTGLTQAELDEAPDFSEFRDFIQDKIGNAVLVGHNIVVDITFLEAFGIKLSGKSIDTLDLVQWLLPTHHSYNLENLMHYFRIPHPDAHRALADSIAVVKVLEKLMTLFSILPDSLQQQVLDFARKANFTWIGLFENNFSIDTEPPFLGQKTLKIKENRKKLDPNVILSVQLNKNDLVQTVPSGEESQYLVVVSNKQQALRLWHEGLAPAIFPPQDLFNESKFRKFAERENLEPNEIKFILKILIWKNTNWQSITILDLNLTFFGGQFREYISPAPTPEFTETNLLCTDYSSLEFASKQDFAKDRQLIISSLHEYERELSTGTERRLSWQRCLYVFRSLEQQNEQEIPAEVFIESIADTDLFFGLVVMTLQKAFPKNEYVALTDLSEQEYANNKIRQAAQNYSDKIERLFSAYKLPEVSRLLANLKTFFADDVNYIKWVEHSLSNCIFFNQPLHVLEDSNKIIKSFKTVSAMEDFSSPVLEYLAGRLGLENFSLTHDTFKKSENNILLKFIGENPAQLISQQTLPTAVVMGSLSQVKDFYNENYDNLKQFATIYAQGYSGGSNKIMRNFGIKPENILIATSNILIQQEGRRIKPKVLIITDYPHENMAHPYTKALAEYWRERFPDIESILDLYLLFRLLKSSLNEGLSTIYVPEPKNDRDRYIYKSLQELPFLNSSPQS